MSAHPLPSEALLPETGRDVGVPIAAGIGLLAVGGVLVISARRNTKERT